MKKYTNAELLRLYYDVFKDPPGYWRDAEEKKSIANEMRRIIEAKTIKEAMAVIEWWGCWNDDRELRRDVKKVRLIAGAGI
jgi:hypothetical protein